MALIELDCLTVKYAGRKRPTLDGVSLQLRAGETVLLLGASGCGKSTLALTLNGLIPHSVGTIAAGTARVDGLDTQRTQVAELARTVGIVFQDPEAQFVTQTVEDEILFGLENLRVPPDAMDERVDRSLAAVDLAAARTRRVDQLSGGQKQRVALAALLAMGPRVLIFDEPTANLDPVGTRDVFALLAALKEHGGHTIVLIEHKLDALMHLIDRVIVLGAGGRPLADGPPRDIFDRQGALLEAEGIWMPQVCLLARRLRALGLDVTPFPVTLAEAETGLAGLAGPDTFRLPAFPAPPPEPTVARPPDVAAAELRGLSFAYGPRPILRDISLVVPPGDFLALVGANGAGKTTLAQHLVGILPAPRATLFIGGRDVRRLSAREVTRQVGYIFQNPEHQFVTDSVLGEVAYSLRARGLPRDEADARGLTLLERFGLARYAAANPFTLSHGEKRRLSVAAMLAMGQETLILDEPTFGQDQGNARELLALLRELHAEGRTIIVVTHDMALVAEHARHVAVLGDGRLLFHGTPRALFARPDLLTAAHLTPPPMIELAARLAARDPRWPQALTLDGFVASLGDVSPRAVG